MAERTVRCRSRAGLVSLLPQSARGRAVLSRQPLFAGTAARVPDGTDSGRLVSAALSSRASPGVSHLVMARRVRRGPYRAAGDHQSRMDAAARIDLLRLHRLARRAWRHVDDRDAGYRERHATARLYRRPP